LRVVNLHEKLSLCQHRLSQLAVAQVVLRILDPAATRGDKKLEDADGGGGVSGTAEAEVSSTGKGCACRVKWGTGGQ